MKSVRNTPTAFRFDPSVKEALNVISDRDGRSMANMLEWLIKKHCEREGLGWPPVGAQSEPVQADAQQSKRPAKKAVRRTTKK